MYAFNMQNNLVSASAEPLTLTTFPGIALLKRGKDKDVYDLGDMLFMVATDRLSAGGKNLGKGIKGKGRIINQLSTHWFRKLRKVFPNHLVSADSSCFPEQLKTADENLDGCSMLVWKTTPLPIRCVVRGYLAGAGWREYQEKGKICGNNLPPGLVESQRLPAPIFAPTEKGQPGGRNANIEFEALKKLIGSTLAEQIRDVSLRLYFTAWQSARERGVLIADTKFEFGLHDGKLMLIDECLTPDTTRFWEIERYRFGATMPSMDKQLLIDFLDAMNNHDEAALLSEEMLCRIDKNYREAFSRIITAG